MTKNTKGDEESLSDKVIRFPARLAPTDISFSYAYKVLHSIISHDTRWGQFVVEYYDGQDILLLEHVGTLEQSPNTRFRQASIYQVVGIDVESPAVYCVYRRKKSIAPKTLGSMKTLFMAIDTAIQHEETREEEYPFWEEDIYPLRWDEGQHCCLDYLGTISDLADR